MLPSQKRKRDDEQRENREDDPKRIHIPSETEKVREAHYKDDLFKFLLEGPGFSTCYIVVAKDYLVSIKNDVNNMIMHLAQTLPTTPGVFAIQAPATNHGLHTAMALLQKHIYQLDAAIKHLSAGGRFLPSYVLLLTEDRLKDVIIRAGVAKSLSQDVGPCNAKLRCGGYCKNTQFKSKFRNRKHKTGKNGSVTTRYETRECADGHEHSVWRDTYISKIRKSLGEMLYVNFSIIKDPNVSFNTIENNVKVSREYFGDTHSLIHEAMGKTFRSLCPKVLGNQASFDDTEIKIVGKGKYSVFGVCEMATGMAVDALIDGPTTENIRPHMSRMVDDPKGKVGHVDGARCFISILNEMEMKRLVVKHSEGWKDPVTKACTNGKESHWSEMKQLKRFKYLTSTEAADNFIAYFDMRKYIRVMGLDDIDSYIRMIRWKNLRKIKERIAFGYSKGE